MANSPQFLPTPDRHLPNNVVRYASKFLLLISVRLLLLVGHMQDLAYSPPWAPFPEHPASPPSIPYKMLQGDNSTILFHWLHEHHLHIPFFPVEGNRR